MISIFKIRCYDGIRLFMLAFSEIDNKWHFVDLEKENIRWKPFDSKEEAIQAVGDDLIGTGSLEIQKEGE